MEGRKAAGLGGEAATAKRRAPAARARASIGAESADGAAGRVGPAPLAASPAAADEPASPYPASYNDVKVNFFRFPDPYVQPTNPYSALVDSQSFAVVDRFRLECGVELRNVEVAFKTWGELAGQEDGEGDGVGNVVVVCHALSGSADVADWWSSLIGPGRPLDPSTYFVISFNALGSPYGTTSPLTLNPATGKPYGPDFPRTTVRDDVALQAIVLKNLGVRKIRGVIGGSMGGFFTLEYAAMFPSLVHSILPIASCAYHSAWTISWSETQRQAIFADPAYNVGRYPVPEKAGEHVGGPEAGLKAARMIALMTYRTRESLEGRFGRGRVPLLLPPPEGRRLGLIESENRGVLAAPAPEDQEAEAEGGAGWDTEFEKEAGLEDILHNEGMTWAKLYDVRYEQGYGNRGGGKRSDEGAGDAAAAGNKSLGGEQDDLETGESDEDETEEPRAVFFAQTYLRHHASKFVARFDANCYIAITRKMDTHDVARGRVGARDARGRKLAHRERAAAVLAEITCPALVIGVDTDNLYPLVEQKDMADALPRAQFSVVRSLHGHDGFLIEMPQVGRLVDEFLRRVPEAARAAIAPPDAEFVAKI
ncbi:Alpha/Beta hydrolase protein [Hyaloraphidium curvatum]|nr:Alpha/Beta hydrolase protein [Hyaloraphidium curvatum]